MNFVSYTYRSKPIDPDLPAHALANAPELATHIACDQCGRPGMKCNSNAAGLGMALAAGWRFRLNQDVYIPAKQLVHAADLLDMNIEIFCPPCAGEFE